MFTIIVTLVLALIGAVALYVVNETRRSFDKNEVVTVFPLRKYAALPFILPVCALVFESFTIVPAGHVGVQVTMGTVNPSALHAGVNFVNPISNVKDVEIRVKRADLKEAQAGTKDLQQVHTDIVIQYRMNPEKVPTIYSQFGLNVDDKILGPGVNEAFKAVTAHYNSEELITKRDVVSTEILEHVRAKVAPFDIEIQGISLVNFGFSAAYQQAIEQKVIATQQKQKAEQDLERIKVEAQQAIATAEGRAKAIQIETQAINSQGGAAYVQLEAIKKWDGKLPNVNGGGVVPFINVGK
jgi:regulator of protease activity HflC (stomatin/prohibitin superfamily)